MVNPQSEIGLCGRSVRYKWANSLTHYHTMQIGFALYIIKNQNQNNYDKKNYSLSIEL